MKQKQVKYTRHNENEDMSKNKRTSRNEKDSIGI